MTVLIQDNSLYIAWVGDSQVVLAKNGEAVKIMEPHKPEREVLDLLAFISNMPVYFHSWKFIVVPPEDKYHNSLN